MRIFGHFKSETCFRLVWDVLEPPVNIYGHPTSVAHFHQKTIKQTTGTENVLCKAPGL